MPPASEKSLHTRASLSISGWPSDCASNTPWPSVSTGRQQPVQERGRLAKLKRLSASPSASNQRGACAPQRDFQRSSAQAFHRSHSSRPLSKMPRMEPRPAAARCATPESLRSGSRAPPSTSASVRSRALCHGSSATAAAGAPHRLRLRSACSMAERNGLVRRSVSAQIKSCTRNSTLHAAAHSPPKIAAAASSAQHAVRVTAKQIRAARPRGKRTPSARCCGARSSPSSGPASRASSSSLQQNSGFPASSATASWRQAISSAV